MQETLKTSNYNSLVLLFLCIVVNKPGYYMVVTLIKGQSNVSKSLTTRWCWSHASQFLHDGHVAEKVL